ncbi:MAG TPA: sulfite dehydrogenase [Ferrovibrio sp.]|uniref:sulfite dehydrogenase n=1 Tax=Ferrovibrio sp. TaxID=1917215 RepID=UPI002B4B08CC|nr:sulfite dehydrogenase [Ferrovibrio sp.]HLT76690.1 sulfite dehydrogenase [Ferrovibrio sp.]
MPPTAGRPSRRGFLKGSAAAGGAALLAGAGVGEAMASGPDNLPPNVPEWMQSLGPGVTASPYGMPSPHERHIVRRNVPWLTATEESSINFTPLHELDGIITPNGLCFERHHGGVPEIDPAQHRLMIHGLVDRPLIFTMDDLMRFPSVSRIHFLECPANGGMEWRGAQMAGVQFSHGMVHCCEWTGVRLSTLLAEVGVQKPAKWLLAEGADAAAMTRSIPLDKAMDDVILAYSQNGERVRPENGYPLRLMVPGWEGNVNVKWLRRIKIGDQPWHHREETSRYTDLMPDGKARQFTFVQEANSVITSPCPEKPMKFGKGFYEIRGIAWSGYGRISKVDVSLDGGMNWQTAELQKPVLSKSLTRFRFPLQWDGRPLLLQSRATDESGYVQPTIEALRKVRGINSIYHKNSIHTWRVHPGGEVENVQIG